MNHRKPRGQPESKAANRLVQYMKARYWGIWKLGGGKFTVGWPDFYAFHRTHGHRWVETKTHEGRLRSSQIDKFRQLTDAGDSVYVLTDEKDYYKLFNNANWMMFIRGIIS